MYVWASSQRSIRSMHDVCKGRILVQASSSSSCCDKAPPTPDGDSSSSDSRVAVLAPRTLSRRGILTRRAAVVWLHALPKGIRRELLTSRAAAMAPRTTTAAGNRLTNYKFCKSTIATDGFASASQLPKAPKRRPRVRKPESIDKQTTKIPIQVYSARAKHAFSEQTSGAGRAGG